MDLVVNHKIIAVLGGQAVCLNPILGAFELVIQASCTIHGATEGIYGRLTIAGSRVSMRSASSQSTQLGRAVPDNAMVMQQVDESSRANFSLKLLLQPYQLELLERERDGGNLDLVLHLLTWASTSDNPQNSWEQHQSEMYVHVPESAWVAQLNQSNAGRLLLLEIRLPAGKWRHPAEKHLTRAQELLAEGDWRSCVSECRQFAEALGGARLSLAANMFRNDQKTMTKDQREALIIASLQNYGHLAAHSESRQGELNYSREDAKLALSLAAVLAEYHFNHP